MLSNGVTSRPISEGAVNWTQSAGGLQFHKGCASHPFMITDVTQSGGNVEIATNLEGGFPDTGSQCNQSRLCRSLLRKRHDEHIVFMLLPQINYDTGC
jgi:hypothetical protein